MATIKDHQDLANSASKRSLSKLRQAYELAGEVLVMRDLQLGGVMELVREAQPELVRAYEKYCNESSYNQIMVNSMLPSTDAKTSRKLVREAIKVLGRNFEV